ncbi:MAG TPA: hypothetical protein VF779_07055 [Pyrinomonadaceae bacterium]
MRSKTKLFVLVFAALLIATNVSVQAQQDMQNMPGMNKPNPKSKANQKPVAKRKQPAQAKPKQTDADQMNGMEMPAVSPTPTPTPEPKEMPSPTEMSMPGMNMPTGTPSPAPSPEKREENAPQTSPSPDAQQKGDMSDMNMSGTGNQSQPAKSDDSMQGMKMDGMTHPSSGTGRVSADDPRALMIMSGEMMEIRLGSSQRNSIAMGQMGSGTSWQPTTTPMYMWTKAADKWLVFIHGDAKIGVNAEGGPRGVTKIESQNWIMPMAFRRVKGGTLQLRGMFSLEPLTFSPGGSPQLFQTGESYKGVPLVDKQHPHDLFMELSASYTVPLGERATWFVYGGFPGEPALGPTAFMHRWSASENPSAPLAHHLQDSTHISFGVVSTGFTYRWFKLEGSLFNGREPDENRYNFEFHPLNSRSVRLSIAPTENLSMQWSYGLLKDPEALKPGDVRRMTASVSYNKRFERGNWATSLIWGRNDESHTLEVESLNGYLAESTVNFLDKNYIYTRLELVDKTDLLSDGDIQRLGILDHHAMFRIGAYTFGAARDVWKTNNFSLAVGSDVTFYSKPDVLDSIYGVNPISGKFFLRIRPNRMSMGSSGQ